MRQKVLLIASAAAIVAASVPAEQTPRSRSFSFTYEASVKDIPAGAKQLDLWVPVPHDDPYQTITNPQIASVGRYEITHGSNGNVMLHVRVNRPPTNGYSLELTFHAVRIEHVQPALFGGPRLAQDENAAELAQYLRPDRLVPIDGQIRAWAREVVTAANAHTDLEMARAIYLHVVSTMKYDKTGKGWGRGDIYYACEERRGNCTDFHAMFIGYARAMGIPARFAIGFPLPADRGQGRIAGYHCWAEFYAKGIGWVPIDASEAAKHPEKRDYFFGHHDENRIEFTKGRDLILAPPQKGELLNYFIYPYAEVDGKTVATDYTVTYRDDQPAQTTAAVSR